MKSLTFAGNIIWRYFAASMFCDCFVVGYRCFSLCVKAFIEYTAALVLHLSSPSVVGTIKRNSSEFASLIWLPNLNILHDSHWYVIEAGKLAKVFLGGPIINRRSLVFIRIASQMDLLAIHANIRSPRVAFLVPANALEFACASGLRTSISIALRWSANSEICPAVVKRVVIDMIDNLARLRIENKARHLFLAPLAILLEISPCSPSVARHVSRLPFALIYALIIFVVHQCNLALGKWYFLYHCILHSLRQNPYVIRHLLLLREQGDVQITYGLYQQIKITYNSLSTYSIA